LPRSLILGTSVVTILYILVNFAFLGAVSIESLAGVDSVATKVGSELWGPAGGMIVSLVIAIGLVSTVSAMIIVGPRVYEAMARDSLFPSSLAKLNRHGVPSLAVGFQAAVSIVFAMTATFETLLIYIGFTLNIFAALSVFAVIRIRKQNKLSIRTCWGYPVTPAVFLLFTIWMTVWSIKSQPVSALAGLGTMAAGYVIYWIQSRRVKR
ncbi:MAG TPA: amino acid permease, partial [Nitrospirae bacterium]|nr:amino acid permease [Nitrospirota bacterium]